MKDILWCPRENLPAAPCRPFVTSEALQALPPAPAPLPLPFIQLHSLVGRCKPGSQPPWCPCLCTGSAKEAALTHFCSCYTLLLLRLFWEMALAPSRQEVALALLHSTENPPDPALGSYLFSPSPPLPDYNSYKSTNK